MDVTKAVHYWDDKPVAAIAKEMPENEKLKAIEDFIREHNTCALATCDFKGNVRNTPVEYLYYDGCFWPISQRGISRKHRCVKSGIPCIWSKFPRSLMTCSAPHSKKKALRCGSILMLSDEKC